MKKIALSMFVSVGLFSTLLSANELVTNGDFSDGTTNGFYGWSGSTISNDNSKLKIIGGSSYTGVAPLGVSQKSGDVATIKFEVLDTTESDYYIFNGISYKKVGTSIPNTPTTINVEFTTLKDYGYYPIKKTGSSTIYIDNVSIMKDDLVAPVLNTTNKTFNTTIWNALTLETVTATDNRDENLIVTQTGTVDFNSAGTYNVVYSVMDSAGNESSITHTYIVTFPENNNPSLDTNINELVVNGNLNDGTTTGFYGWSGSLLSNIENTLKIVGGDTYTAVTPLNVPQEKDDIATIQFDVLDKEANDYYVYNGASGTYIKVGTSIPNTWTRITKEITSAGDYGYYPIRKTGSSTIFMDNISIIKGSYIETTIVDQDDLELKLSEYDNINIINSNINISRQINIDVTKDKIIKFTNSKLIGRATSQVHKMLNFNIEKKSDNDNTGYSLTVDGVNIDGKEKFERLIASNGSTKIINSILTNAKSVTFAGIGLHLTPERTNSIIEIDNNNIHNISALFTGEETTGEGASRAIQVNVKESAENTKVYVKNNTLHDIFSYEGDILYLAQDTNWDNDIGTEFYIQNNTIENSNRRQIKLQVARVTIQGNTITSINKEHQHFNKGAGPEGMVTVSSKGNFPNVKFADISNNTFNNKGGTGSTIVLWNADNVNIYDNDFKESYMKPFYIRFDSKNIEVYNNDITLNEGVSIIDGTSKNVSFHNNNWIISSSNGKTPRAIFEGIGSGVNNLTFINERVKFSDSALNKNDFLGMFYIDAPHNTLNATVNGIEFVRVDINGDDTNLPFPNNNWRWNIAFLNVPITGATFSNNTVEGKTNLYFNRYE